MELKTALAVICQHFELRTSKASEDLNGLDEKMALTLQAANGIRLHCIPRGVRA